MSDDPDPHALSWILAGMLMEAEGKRWDDRRIREMVGILSKLQKGIHREMGGDTGGGTPTGVPIRIGGQLVYLNEDDFVRILDLGTVQDWIRVATSVYGVVIYTRLEEECVS